MEGSAMRLMKFEQGLSFDKLIRAMLEGEGVPGPSDTQAGMGREDPSDDTFSAAELTGLQGLQAYSGLQTDV